MICYLKVFITVEICGLKYILKFLNLVENQFPFSASYFFSLADQRGIYTGNSFGIEIKEMAPFKIENFFSA